MQSVLSTIPYYIMQSARLPISVCENIDKKVRQFIWGGTNERRSVNLVRWDKVTQPKYAGRLGIKSVRDMNLAFLTKLGWRILDEENALWVQVLKGKYMKVGEGVGDWKIKAGASNAWKGIIEASPILRKATRLAPWNGRNMRFWGDTWLLPEPLQMHTLKDLSDYEMKKTVAEYWDPT